MSNKVIVRILGPVGSGKSAVYATIANALSSAGIEIKHQDEQAWISLNNSGEVDSAAETLNELAPTVVLEEAGTRIENSKNPIMQFFAYGHLPMNLQRVSKPFALLAQEMDQYVADGPEKSAGLRKLLEAKDCIVRQLIAK